MQKKYAKNRPTNRLTNIMWVLLKVQKRNVGEILDIQKKGQSLSCTNPGFLAIQPQDCNNSMILQSDKGTSRYKK